jgi:hypothetical protein
MSKYRVGDVVQAPISYFDTKAGYYNSQSRRWVIVKIDEDTGNTTVACTGELHQSNKWQGFKVTCNSQDGKSMGLTKDTFVYCEITQTVDFSDGDITMRWGNCPFIEKIIEKLKI